MVLGRHRRVAAVLVVGLVAAGCGSGSSVQPATSTASSFPVSVSAANGAVTIASRPRRIVSLSPTATEMLFAIGARSQVAAVDADSSYPASAPHTSLSGFQPNVEAIASYRPDLVVAASDPGGLVRSLSALNIPVLIEPAAQRLSDSYDQLHALGAATGHGSAADDLVRSMRSQIAQIVSSTPKAHPAVSVYVELDDTYFSADSSTFIGQVYQAFGVQNIADRAKSGGSGYPQLSAESIVQANPDLIFLADTRCCHQTAATVAARPGWSGIAAVRDHQVVPVNDDIASRWGPRIVELYRIVADHVRAVEAAAA